MAKPKTKTDEAPAAELTAEDRLYDLRATLRFEIKEAQTIISALSQELADPDREAIEVLGWSTRAFEAAATLQVAKEVSARLDAGESIVDVHESLVRAVLSGARSGSSSTSAVNNYCKASTVSAFAKFEELMRYAAKKLAATEAKKLAATEVSS